jgi:hypothetical protein
MMSKTVPELLIGVLEQVGVMKRTGDKDRTSMETTMSARMGGPLPFLQEALTIAKFEPGIYEVVRTFAPAGEPN